LASHAKVQARVRQSQQEPDAKASRYLPTLNGTVAVMVSHAIASFPLFCVTSLKKIVN
jgi:hypothetical protein